MALQSSRNRTNARRASPSTLLILIRSYRLEQLDERTNERPPLPLAPLCTCSASYPSTCTAFADTQTLPQRRRPSKAREKHSSSRAADDTQVVCALRCSCDYGNGSWTIRATSRAISRTNEPHGMWLENENATLREGDLSPQPLESTCLHCPDGARTTPWLVILSTVIALSSRVESSF
ncbi:hypothetical protein BDZ97DRAFT_1823014, partial [Flammula alnicola]